MDALTLEPQAVTSLPPTPWRPGENGVIVDANGKPFAIIAIPQPPSLEERLAIAESMARELCERANCHDVLARAVRAAYRGFRSAWPAGTDAWVTAQREVLLGITLLDG